MNELISIETPLGRFWTRPNDFVTRQLRELGGHQRSELGMILSFLREGDVVIDVGAHIGTICVPVASRIGPSGRVFAFEPVRESFDILQKNILENGVGDRVVATNALISDSKLEYRVELADDHTSAAHFAPRAGAPDAPQGPSAERTAGSPAVVHLAEWAARPEVGLDALDLLKVDTEGMELRVLESAADLIARYRPVIVAEMSSDHLARAGDSLRDVERFLQGYGYHFFRNEGSRHATDESFSLVRLLSPRHVDGLYDLVAVHPESDRYPESAASPLPDALGWIARRARNAPGAILRRLRR